MDLPPQQSELCQKTQQAELCRKKRATDRAVLRQEKAQIRNELAALIKKMCPNDRASFETEIVMSPLFRRLTPSEHFAISVAMNGATNHYNREDKQYLKILNCWLKILAEPEKYGQEREQLARLNTEPPPTILDEDSLTAEQYEAILSKFRTQQEKRKTKRNRLGKKRDKNINEV